MMDYLGFLGSLETRPVIINPIAPPWKGGLAGENGRKISLAGGFHGLPPKGPETRTGQVTAAKPPAAYPLSEGKGIGI